MVWPLLLVGDALFGEYEYLEQLHHQVKRLGLGDRVHFLGFRSDIPQLMSLCDLIAHTSTAPEPFGRVIVEGMLCGKPVVAAAAATAAAQSLLGKNFGGILNSDRYNAYNWVDVAQRQLCWAHLKREFTKISERSGVSRQLGRDLLAQQKKS